METEHLDLDPAAHDQHSTEPASRAQASGYSGVERRTSLRREPLTFLSLRMLNRRGVRRHPGRRAGDWEAPYVDWYEPKLMLIVIGIFLLACADAFLTLHLWQSGSITLNPFMASLLGDDVHGYVNLKLAVTGFALVMLVVYKNFSVYRIFRVYHLIYALFGFFALVVLNQVMTLLSG